MNANQHEGAAEGPKSNAHSLVHTHALHGRCGCGCNASGCKAPANRAHIHNRAHTRTCSMAGPDKDLFERACNGDWPAGHDSNISDNTSDNHLNISMLLSYSSHACGP
jgi:hypothetical protein